MYQKWIQVSLMHNSFQSHNLQRQEVQGPHQPETAQTSISLQITQHPHIDMYTIQFHPSWKEILEFPTMYQTTPQDYGGFKRRPTTISQVNFVMRNEYYV